MERNLWPPSMAGLKELVHLEQCLVPNEPLKINSYCHEEWQLWVKTAWA